MSARKATITPISVLALVAVAAVVLSSCGDSAASSGNGKPAVVLTPASSSFHNGQVIGVSVGANKYFTPYTRIEVLECADPGGQTANLPKSDYTCDGNTAPGFSILVNKDGSFSTNQYQLYSLPNSTTLGEPRDNQPVCNATHQCVLYVGQDQTNFTAPKVFSAPFAVTPTGSSSPATG